MTKLFSNPTVRLAARAVLAGLLSFGAQMQASSGIGSSVLRSAAVAGILAFAEVFTPLNQTVGLFVTLLKKTPTKTVSKS
jgi:hypothetical protein